MVLVKAYSYPFLSEPKCHVRRRQRRSFSIPPNVMLLSSNLSSGSSKSAAAADLLVPVIVRDESDMTDDEIDASCHWGETRRDHHSNRSGSSSLTADSIDLAEFARCKEESV